MNDLTTFAVGDKVRTNRYFGQKDFADTATVVEIRSSDYVIAYDGAGKRSSDFNLVGRSPENLKAV